MRRIVRVGAIRFGADQQTLWRTQTAALADLKFDVDTVTALGFWLRHRMVSILTPAAPAESVTCSLSDITGPPFSSGDTENF